MLDMKDAQIKQTLPESIKYDQKVNDICDSVQAEFDAANKYSLLVLLLPRLNELSEALVDELAWQFHVDFYRDNFPLETKRNLVRTAIERHRKKGTPAAVEDIIRTVYQDAMVEEWWEWDDGEPYWFRILMTAKDPAPPLSLSEVLELVEEYKSYRSHLEGVYYHVPHNIVIRTGCSWVCYKSRLCGTYPFRATLGKIDDIDLVIHTYNNGLGYRNPYTNEISSGMFPRSTPGRLSDEGIIVTTENDAAGYRNPYTNEAVSGTFPQRATHGGVEGNEVAAETSAGNTSYSVRYCGSIPGSLM